MGLSLPEEPRDIKSFIKSVRSSLGGGIPDIDYDSLAVWGFNKFPKYLWEAWRGELGRRGVTWQKFLRILSLHTKDIVDWALYDRLGWAELVKRITISIDSYSGSGSAGMV